MFVFLAHVDFDIIVEFEILKQPYYALTAGLIEPGGFFSIRIINQGGSRVTPTPRALRDDLWRKQPQDCAYLPVDRQLRALVSRSFNRHD